MQRVRTEIRIGIAAGFYPGSATQTQEVLQIGEYAVPRKLGAWPRPPPQKPEERPAKTTPIIRRRRR